MQMSKEASLANDKKLGELLRPLGFHSSGTGMFYLPDHPFIVHDLSAVDADDPKMVMKVLTDSLWDFGVEVGISRQQKLVRKALGI